ncbi:MAG: zinc ribbon domain-containing protein [Chloroflexi bacterium]|nr:zinc ribbon domain-containing protein [Chloroflexota bacterium]MCL5107672.1 zinc ribbon domain-containing protein [Chloroflexota bacterium]
MIRCNECGLQNSGQARYCSGCGTVLPVPRLCPDCGFENAVGSRFCCQCGLQLAVAEASPQSENNDQLARPEVNESRDSAQEDAWLEAERLMWSMAEPEGSLASASAVSTPAGTPGDWLTLAGGLVSSALALAPCSAGEGNGPQWPTNPFAGQFLDFDAAGAVLRKQCGLVASSQRVAKGRASWTV